MKTNPITDGLLILMNLFRDLVLGRGITAGWPIQVGPKPTSCLLLWALTVLPVWFFCFVTFMHIAFDILSLVPTGKAGDRNEIHTVLTCTSFVILIGLYAAQLSVAVTPTRFVRPLMSLWILVIPICSPSKYRSW